MLQHTPHLPRTETPVQFTDGHDVPREPIDSHGNPMAPIPGQQWSIADPVKKIGKSSVQVDNWHVHVVTVTKKTMDTWCSSIITVMKYSSPISHNVSSCPTRNLVGFLLTSGCRWNFPCLLIRRRFLKYLFESLLHCCKSLSQSWICWFRSSCTLVLRVCNSSVSFVLLSTSDFSASDSFSMWVCNVLCFSDICCTSVEWMISYPRGTFGCTSVVAVWTVSRSTS